MIMTTSEAPPEDGTPRCVGERIPGNGRSIRLMLHCSNPIENLSDKLLFRNR